MEPIWEYRLPTLEELVKIWDKDIAAHPGDSRWARWKEEYLAYYQNGQAKTFLALRDGEPVGQGTLLFSPDCGAVDGRLALANNRDTANVNALRIEKPYENQGHISRLMKVMEDYALANGYPHLTIGVDAIETRNLSIYLHWNYTHFLFPSWEDGLTVLYYQKDLK